MSSKPKIWGYFRLRLTSYGSLLKRGAEDTKTPLTHPHPIKAIVQLSLHLENPFITITPKKLEYSVAAYTYNFGMTFWGSGT